MRPTGIPLCCVALLCLVCACDEKPGGVHGSPSIPGDGGGGGGGSAGAGGAGGSGGAVELPPLTPVCPEPDGAPTLGDINGDGRLDVADAVALGNHLFRGGPAPVCAEAADFNGDGRIEFDDALRINSHLVSGTQHLRESPPGACAASQPWGEGACHPMGLWWEAPERVSEAGFDAVLAVRSPEVGVEGWSLSLRAEGCQIAAVTTRGTSAAEVWDAPPGLRHLGYAAAVTVPEGAVSYVLLSFYEDITLPVREEPSPILVVRVEAAVPQEGCTSCLLSVGDGLTWRGQPIDFALVAGGRTYRPDAPVAKIEVCAPAAAP